MNRLIILSLVVILALQLHSAAAGLTCPVDYHHLITETMRASDIHREWLDKGWSTNRSWDEYWQKTHLDTAIALSQATIGCE